MICYHSTKTLDENIILTFGLQTNEWNAYSTHIIKTLHTLEVSEEEITQAVEAIKRNMIGNILRMAENRNCAFIQIQVF